MQKTLKSFVLCAALSLALVANAAPGPENFYKSSTVTLQKVSFNNLYKMKVGANLYLPKNYKKGVKYPAVIIGHPMGAVKEQGSNLYAQKLAEKGFVTLAIDLSFWGDSDGQPRNAVLPDVYAEDFSAAVDYLGSSDFVDPNKIGALGICGSGSFAISAAKIDPRIKAVATASMYNMGNAVRHGLNNSFTDAQRRAFLEQAAQQRYVEFEGGKPQYTSGTPHEINEKSSDIEKEFYSFYRTSRGEFTPEGVDEKTTTHPTLTSHVKFMNFYPFEDIETISPRPMLFITGDRAHSREFSEDAYKRAAEPKELYIVKGANHVDLYDDTSKIPFDKIADFFNKSFH